MSELLKFVVYVCIGAAVLTLGIWAGSAHDGVVIYRCDWSEISPDIPIEVKQECRKRIMHGTI